MENLKVEVTLDHLNELNYEINRLENEIDFLQAIRKAQIEMIGKLRFQLCYFKNHPFGGNEYETVVESKDGVDDRANGKRDCKNAKVEARGSRAHS